MLMELSQENQEKIKKGIKKMPCPNCGEYLTIGEEQSLPAGDKGIVYKCTNNECGCIAGSVLISWHTVISNALKNHIVKVALFAFALGFTFIGSKFSACFTPTGTQKDAWTQLNQELKAQGCLKDNEKPIECIKRVFDELERYQKAEEWAAQKPYKPAILSFLEGKQKGINEIHRKHSDDQFSTPNNALKSLDIAVLKIEGRSLGNFLGNKEANRLLKFVSDKPITNKSSVNTSYRSSAYSGEPQ